MSTLFILAFCCRSFLTGYSLHALLPFNDNSHQILDKLESGDVGSIHPQLWSSLQSTASVASPPHALHSGGVELPLPSTSSASSSSASSLPSASSPTSPVALVFPPEQYRQFRAQPPRQQQHTMMQQHALLDHAAVAAASAGSPAKRKLASPSAAQTDSQAASSSAPVSAAPADSALLTAAASASLGGSGGNCSSGVQVAWQLTLRILSSWGHGYFVGLTQV
jgi:hypothetical protein